MSKDKVETVKATAKAISEIQDNEKATPISGDTVGKAVVSQVKQVHG
jgi:hypothetical protein